MGENYNEEGEGEKKGILRKIKARGTGSFSVEGKGKENARKIVQTVGVGEGGPKDERVACLRRKLGRGSQQKRTHFLILRELRERSELKGVHDKRPAEQDASKPKVLGEGGGESLRPFNVKGGEGALVSQFRGTEGGNEAGGRRK